VTATVIPFPSPTAGEPSAGNPAEDDFEDIPPERREEIIRHAAGVSEIVAVADSFAEGDDEDAVQMLEQAIWVMRDRQLFERAERILGRRAGSPNSPEVA
jgi:hypothetical protein